MVSQDPHVVFFFSGQGNVPQEAPRDLYQNCNVFRRSIDEIDDAVERLFRSEGKQRPHVALSEFLQEKEIRPAYQKDFASDEELEYDERGSPPPATLVIVSSLYALAKTIEDQGIRPSSIIGYSLGEQTASLYTKSLPMEAAMKLVVRRERLLQDDTLFTNAGITMSAQTSGENAMEILRTSGAAEGVEVASFLSPKAVAFAGETPAMETAKDALKENGVKVQVLSIPVGVHSAHVQNAVNELRENPEVFPATDSVDAKVVPGIDHWSSSGHQLAVGTPLDADFWASQLRAPIDSMGAIKGVYDKHMAASPKRKLVYFDLSMGPKYSKIIEDVLEDTPKMKSGQVRAVSCIPSALIADQVKSKLGWALDELKKNLRIGLD